MKRIGKVILCLLMALVFGYLFLIDYPATMSALIPEEDTGETDSEESESAEEQSSTDGQNVDGIDVADLKSQISSTKVILLAGDIYNSLYDEIYPVLSGAGYTGTLLFLNGHLTGDYGKITTKQFLELEDAGWGVAVGEKNDQLSAEEWKKNLQEQLDDVKQRSGNLPTVYFFQEGEYQTELETILSEEGLSAFYYSVEDYFSLYEDVSDNYEGTTDLRKNCYITFTEDLTETYLEEMLNLAWHFEYIAFRVDADPDEEEKIKEVWGTLISKLETDSRFIVTSQSDWLNAQLENDSSREKLVESVLQEETEE